MLIWGGYKGIQINYSHGQKSWDTYAFLGRFPIQTGPTPPLTPQTMLDACIQIFFPCFNFVLGGGGGGGWGERTATKFRKGCTVLRGDQEMTEKYEILQYCPKDFCPGL